MRLARLLTALAALPLATAVLAVPAHAEEPPAHVPVWDKGPGGERYVAFGDSFVSGPGISPQRAVGCSRSERNFATLVATGLDVTSYVDASCGGATTRHFTESQGGNAPQLDALGADTTLVTFGTMGGNDIGLVQLGLACAAAAETSCVPEAGTDPLAARFEEARKGLVSGLAATRERAPKAEVFVVGYGTYVPPGGCPDTFLGLVDAAEFDHLQGQIDRLSDLLRQVARDAGVAFVDQRSIPGALDHTVCAWPDQQWIRGINDYGDGSQLHPSSAGMKATADYLLTRIAEQRLAALKAKAKTVRAGVTCQQRGRTVRAKVTGGQGAVVRVEWKVGARRVGLDRTKPFVLTAKAKKVRRLDGRQRVVVTLRDKDARVVRTLTPRRPRCAR